MQTTSWPEKYHPRSRAEIVVPKKKAEAMVAFLEKQSSKASKPTVLFLSGPVDKKSVRSSYWHERTSLSSNGELRHQRFITRTYRLRARIDSTVAMPTRVKLRISSTFLTEAQSTTRLYQTLSEAATREAEAQLF